MPQKKLWKLIDYKTLIKVLILVVGFYAFGPIAILVIILWYFIVKLVETSRFSNLQATLPTSKIASMSIGLVEVKGRIKMLEPLIAPVGNKQCIGYHCIIQEENNDDEHNDYTTVSDETYCNDFIIEDGTGEVQVKADGIDLLWLEETVYNNGSQRYIQSLLLENQEVLLIGKANVKDNTAFIEKEPVKNIFTLASYNSVTRWNRFKPLLNRFLMFLMLFFLLTAFILLSEITVTGNLVQFHSVFEGFALHNLFNTEKMSVLPVKLLPFFDNIIAVPGLMVLWAALGMLLLLLPLLLLSKLYSFFKCSRYISCVYPE